MRTLPWWQHPPNLCPKQPSSLSNAITSSTKLSTHQQITNETRPWHFPSSCFSGKELELCWDSSTRYPCKPLDHSMQDHSKTQHISAKEPNVHGNYRLSTKPRLYHKNELKNIMNRTDGRNIFSFKKKKNKKTFSDFFIFIFFSFLALVVNSQNIFTFSLGN